MDVIVNNCCVRINNIEDIIFHKKKIQQQVVNLEEELKEKKEELDKLIKYLYINCKHNWITDSIDSMKNYKLGKIIKYCEKCELSG